MPITMSNESWKHHLQAWSECQSIIAPHARVHNHYHFMSDVHSDVTFTATSPSNKIRMFQASLKSSDSIRRPVRITSFRSSTLQGLDPSLQMKQLGRAHTQRHRPRAFWGPLCESPPQGGTLLRTTQCFRSEPVENGDPQEVKGSPVYLEFELESSRIRERGGGERGGEKEGERESESIDF